MKQIFVLVFSLLILTACKTTVSDNVGPPAFDLTCDLSVDYAAAVEAQQYPTSETYVATVIVLHGKNGSPNHSAVQTLKTKLNESGYDVVMPTMPWSGFAWNGTWCESISHINDLIVEEKNAGNPVILLGHSMAGPIVLSYSALTNTTDPDGLVVLAPGHIPHQSSVLASKHADSIAKAKGLIAGQNSDVTSFQTYNGGTLRDITSTPEVYLSFHDTEKFPNIEASLGVVDLPILWLAGSDDNLTVVMDGTFGLPGKMPVSDDNVYKVIDGTHFSLVNNVTVELNTWYEGL